MYMYECVEYACVYIIHLYIYIYKYIIYDQGAASSNKSLYVFGIPGAFFFFLSLRMDGWNGGWMDGWMDALSLA